MDARQKKSFSGFLFAFMGIIAVAFGVLIWSGHKMQQVEPVDNIAQPN